MPHFSRSFWVAKTSFTFRVGAEHDQRELGGHIVAAALVAPENFAHHHLALHVQIVVGRVEVVDAVVQRQGEHLLRGLPVHAPVAAQRQTHTAEAQPGNALAGIAENVVCNAHVIISPFVLSRDVPAVSRGCRGRQR